MLRVRSLSNFQFRGGPRWGQTTGGGDAQASVLAASAIGLELALSGSVDTYLIMVVTILNEVPLARGVVAGDTCFTMVTTILNHVPLRCLSCQGLILPLVWLDVPVDPVQHLFFLPSNTRSSIFQAFQVDVYP